MNALIIPGTRNTPSIWFEPSSGRFEMSGTSIPANASEFYQPVCEWLAINLSSLERTAVFHFRMSYFNSTSLKGIFQVLRQLKGAKTMGTPIEVRWYVEDDDEFMNDAAEMFMEMLDFPFEVVTVPHDTELGARQAS